MSEGINDDLGIRVNTIEVDYEIEKRKIYHLKDADTDITFKTGNQADNKTKYLVSVHAKDFSYKGYLSHTLSKENIGLFTYGITEDADCYCGNWYNDEKTGEGIYYYPPSKDIYIGNWLRNKKEGQGIYLSSEKNTTTLCLGNFNGDLFKEGMVVTYQTKEKEILVKTVYKGKVDEKGVKNDEKGVIIENNIIYKGRVENDEKKEGFVVVLEGEGVKYAFKMNKIEDSQENDYSFSINEDKEIEKELIAIKKKWDESNLINRVEQYIKEIVQCLAEANCSLDEYQTALEGNQLQNKISKFNELVKEFL